MDKTTRSILSLIIGGEKDFKNEDVDDIVVPYSEETGNNNEVKCEKHKKTYENAVIVQEQYIKTLFLALPYKTITLYMYGAENKKVKEAWDKVIEFYESHECEVIKKRIDDDANANAGGPPSDIDDKNEDDKDGKSSDSSKKRKFSNDEDGPDASAMDSREDALKKRLSEKNLEQVIIDGDGNCQFRAIAHQLNQLHPDPRDHVDHADVRTAIIDHMGNNDDLYSNFIAYNGVLESDGPTYTDYNNFLNRMGRNGHWGDNLTLQAAANTYRITIRIYSLNGDDLVLLPDGHERSTDLREIRVIYNGVNHYNSTCSTIGE